jgi:lipopolysaccharide transport system ATP-binding protein
MIEVENLSKLYELGTIGGRTLRESLERQWYRLRGKEHELQKVGARRQTMEPGHPQAGPRPNTMWALKDVSFTVKEGEVLGIIGRNGAGKSTLLKLLTRITEPTSGRALVYGRVASLLEVGTGFHPELTGRENIYLNGAILGMKKAEIDRKFDEIVAFSGVEQFIDTPVKRYSSGMYVRLAFAVAAHLDPEILLVDEVLAVGDAEFQKKCVGKMGDVARGGRTVLLVSHNMPSVEALCGRALLLDDGRTSLCGKTQLVVAHYLLGSCDVESSEIDLGQHNGRSHSAEPALRRAWVSSANGGKSNRVRMGGSLRFSFQFECRNAVVNPGFGAMIEDERGNGLLTLNNYVIPTEKNTFSSIRSGVVEFWIPKLPLISGTYFVTLCLTEDNRRWVDCVDRALAIHVQPADVYGSGKIPDNTYGPVLALWDVVVSRGEVVQQREPGVACDVGGLRES